MFCYVHIYYIFNVRAIIPKVKQLTNKLLQKRSRQLQDELELNKKNFM